MSDLLVRHMSYMAPMFTVWLLCGAVSNPAVAQTDYGSIGWTPAGAALTVSAAGDVYAQPLEPRPAYRLTMPKQRDVHASWAPDGSAFVFGSYRDGDAEISVAAHDGADARPLTNDEADNSASPDGERLAFVSVERGEPEGLWVAAPDGSEATEVEGLDARPVGQPSEPAYAGSGGDDAVADTGSSAGDEPRVAILIYDGVQIIDHAAPWEVLGQYSLNEVFTVAKDTAPVTTFMGMRVLPSYGFGDHPAPDVVVIPGGDAGDARADPKVIEWIRRNAADTRYVLGICSGVSLLAEAELLEGRRATTFYNLLDDLAEEHSGITVVEDELVVEDGKYVTTTGTGIEGALHVVELLHGEPWARVVKLNMEFQPLPADARTPRARLADMNLPTGIYGEFPWREAELAVYEGDESRWTMAWRFYDGEISTLAAAVAASLREDGWAEVSDDAGPVMDAWSSDWRLTGRDGEPWTGQVELRRTGDERLELEVRVRS